MIFLQIVSAFLVCAAAAPSHLLAPVAVPAPVIQVAAVPVAYSAAIPTLSPGDVQAAVIDAQVKAQDQAIAAVDKARELNEQAVVNLKQSTEDLKDKVIVGSDANKENNEEAFWAVQDKQWQALDALKTAEAQLDGALARDAPILAKSAVVGPYVIAGIAPVSPAVYTPGIIAPLVKSVEAAKPEEVKSVEVAKPEEVKSAEVANPAENSQALVKSVEENKVEKDSVTIEASTRNLEAKPQLAPLITPLAIQPYYNQGYPIVAPVGPLALGSPVLSYGAISQLGLTPTIVKTAW